jgi:hypothetical protein
MVPVQILVALTVFVAVTHSGGKQIVKHQSPVTVSTLTLLEYAVVTVIALEIAPLKRMVLVHAPVTRTTMVQVAKLVSLATASQPMIQVYALHRVYALVHNTITVQVFANATSSTMVPIALHH